VQIVEENYEIQLFIEDLVAQEGFESSGMCSSSALKVLPAVRDMCAVDTCRSFEKNWSCPPACGSLEDFEALIGRYQSCIVFQTVLPMEDEFDFESITEAQRIHSQRFKKMIVQVNASKYDIALLSAGACNICGPDDCTYPENPCRNPDLMRPSMEAAGLWVSDVCNAAEIPYNHGPLTMAFSSCALF